MEVRWSYGKILQHQKLSPSLFLGYVLALSAAALAALMHVIPKPLLDSNQGTIELNPIVLAFIIYIMNGLLFTPLARKSPSIKKIEKKNLFFLLLIGLAEVSAMITYFFGLKDSTATNGAILSNSEILFSILIAVIIYREKLKKRERTPFSIIIIGLIAIPVGNDFYYNGMVLTKLVMGDLLILLSGLFYALDINICKYVTDRLDSKRMTQITSFASGGFALCLILLLQIPLEISLSHMPGIIITGIAGTAMSAFFFVIALRLIGTIRTILLYSTGSIFGIIFSAIFLSETITLLNVISIALVLIGLYLLRNRLGE